MVPEIIPEIIGLRGAKWVLFLRENAVGKGGSGEVEEAVDLGGEAPVGVGEDVGNRGGGIVGAIESHRLEVEAGGGETGGEQVGVDAFGVEYEFEFVGAGEDGGVDVVGLAEEGEGGVLGGAGNPIDCGGEGEGPVGLDVDAAPGLVEHID